MNRRGGGALSVHLSDVVVGGMFVIEVLIIRVNLPVAWMRCSTSSSTFTLE